ncbi:MAG: ATP-binding protein [Candidatus Omnitrophota bacterium]|nr:ATP-binding protein [Candidatus Omnitrophota bacterium]
MGATAHFYLSAVLTAVLNFLLLLFVSKFARNQVLKIRFIWYGIAIAWWALFLFLFSFIGDQKLSYLFCQLLHGSSIFIPPLFFHFLLSYLQIDKKREWVILRISYIVSAFFWLINIFKSEYFILSVTPKLGFPYFMNPGSLYTAWMVYFFVVVIYGHVTLLMSVIKSEDITRKQRLFFLIGNSLGYVGGIGTFLPVYNITYFPYPYGVYGVALFSLVTAYTSIRFKFIDIEVILKKTLVFAGIVTAAVSTIALPLAIFQAVIGKAFGVPHPFALMALGIATTVLIYRPVERFLVNITDKFLFQKKSEIKVILNRLSERVITIVDMEQIGKTILSTLEETLRLESGLIFLQNKKTVGGYRILDHFGMTAVELTASFQSLIDAPSIIGYFSNNGQTVLNLDHFDEKLDLSETVSNWLKISKSRVCIPLIINEEQFGLLVLGEKKSDQEFTQEEMDFFPTIASQAALAIRNARLIETVVQEREAKAKAQHEAKRVHYAEMLAHEVKNAVTAADLQGRSLYEQVEPKFRLIQGKFFNDSLPPVAIKQYEKMCQKLVEIGHGIQDRCRKIRIITKTAQHYLSSDKTIYEEIYVKMLWEDAVTESDVQNVIFEFKGPKEKDLYVYGNPVLLQRVFVNLIKNADDAMRDQLGKKIALECDYRDVDSNHVGYFKFKDNGPGIAKGNLEKIFERGFSTKLKPKSGDLFASGSGYGLYSCRETIEEFHSGKIWAESTDGEGACFIFWIPVQKNEADKNNQQANA